MAGTGRLLALVGCLALVLAALPGTDRRRRGLLVVGAATTVGAAMALALALVRVDPTIVYVADHARRSSAWWWRLAGLWAGTEGSLLAFAAILTVVAAVACWADHRRGDPSPIGVLAALTAAVVVVSAAVADPFVTLAVPATDGSGMVPILEHPAMLVHPPLTYVGLVTLVVPGARAGAALWRGGAALRSPALARRLAAELRWSWLVLAVAMALGARWAFDELGWGGWWAWDAVESTSLVPWLAVTAALHLLVDRSRSNPGAPIEAMPGMSATPKAEAEAGAPVAGHRVVEERVTGSDVTGPAMASMAMVLALAGTTLTRSGAASSVHAFAEAVSVGWAMGAVTAVTAVAVAAAIVRASWATCSICRATAPESRGEGGTGPDRCGLDRDDLDHDRRVGDGLDRERPAAVAAVGVWADRSWRLVAAGLVAMTCAVVALGTLAPLARRAAGGGPSSTDPSYFARTTTPLAWVLLVTLALSTRPRATVASGNAGVARGRLRGHDVALVAGALAGVALTWGAGATTVGSVTGALAGMAGGGTLAQAMRSVPRPRSTRRHVGTAIVHLGVAVLLVGVGAGTGSWSARVAVAAGESIDVGAITVTNGGARVDPSSPPDRPSVVVPVFVDGHGAVEALRPSVVGFPDMGVRLAETDVASTWRGDLQVAVVSAADDGRAVLEVHWRPLVGLVWLGGALLVAGGLVLVTAARGPGLGAPAPDAGQPVT